MRTSHTHSSPENGSVLMMTLFSAMLIGIVLAGYLTLVRHQEVAVTRSQGWNAALTMAEAGVEEALAQLNSGAASFSGDLSANGWGPPAGGNFNLQSRAMSGGRYDVRYFTNSLSPSPTIYSTGYVTLPAMSATVARQLKVSTAVVPLINMAVAAKYGIQMNGSTFTVDSYDSADPAHSDNGRYPGGYPSRVLANGDVASLYGPVNLGTPTIRGDLFLGPTAGGSGASAAQVTGNIRHDFNVEYPDAAAPEGAPSGSGWLIDNADPHDFGGSGTYTREIRDSHKIIVRGGAKVTLYVTTTNFSPSEIQIQTNLAGISGKLTIYQVAGTARFDTALHPYFFIGVDSRRADSFSYFGLPGVTSVYYNGGGNPFYGVIYAPSANVTLNGSSSFVVGACVARSITMGSSYSFHFDENLMRPGAGPIRGFLAKAWEEQ